MFKYLIVLAVAIACVLAAPPKDDQDTASQYYYGGYSGLHSAYAYPSYGLGYASTYAAYPAYGHHGLYYG
jgi:hypothetical protein